MPTNPNVFVRIIVRKTKMGRFYASSPVIPGLHAYGRTMKELSIEIATSIAQLHQAAGKNVTAHPAAENPVGQEWTWEITSLDLNPPTAACA